MTRSLFDQSRKIIYLKRQCRLTVLRSCDQLQILQIINKDKDFKILQMNPNKFIIKLIQMMNQFPHIINWSLDGQEMEVFDIQKFQNQVYTKYFTTKNYKSFIRQLNMYSFRRISKGKNSASFKHQEFKKGNQAQFLNIRRRRQKNKQKSIENIQGNHLNVQSQSVSQTLVEQTGSEVQSIIQQIKLVISQKGLLLVNHLQRLLLKPPLYTPNLLSNRTLSFQSQPINNMARYASQRHQEHILNESSQISERFFFGSQQENNKNHSYL